MKTQNLIYIIVAIVVIGLIGFLYITFNPSNSPSVDANNGNTGNNNNPNVKTINVNGDNFKFIVNGQENPDITVKQGDKVKIVFTSVGGFHDFVIDELGAKTQQINDGETSTIEFVASKKGTFEYYCSVGTHRQMGMKGKFVVE